MTDKTKKTVEYVALGIGGLIVIMLVLHGNGGIPNAISHSGKTVTQNPQNASIEEALINAKAGAVSAYDQDVLGAESLEEQQNVAYNTNAAQTEQTRISTRGQVQETQLQTAAEQAIANSEATAQEEEAQYQEEGMQSYANAQQNSSLFSNVGSWFTSLFGAFGL